MFVMNAVYEMQAIMLIHLTMVVSNNCVQKFIKYGLCSQDALLDTVKDFFYCPQFQQHDSLFIDGLLQVEDAPKY